jgi:predicted DNA binding CopG/RHH family protein
MFGSDILDYIHKDDLEKTKKALTQKDRNLTVRIKKKNGNHCTMHVQAKEFGINSKKYSIGLMTCVDKGCPDCDK